MWQDDEKGLMASVVWWRVQRNKLCKLESCSCWVWCKSLIFSYALLLDLKDIFLLEN